jgi:hypothetical protein
VQGIAGESGGAEVKQTESERKEAKRIYDARRHANRSADQIAKKREVSSAYRSRAKAARTTISAERLRELLHYDPEIGVFTRRVSTRGALAGNVAGYMTQDGYVGICVDGAQYKAHRLAWLYVYGVWPAKEIDHRDTVRHHNWISNLRECDGITNNQQNQRRAQRGSATGLLGVYRTRNKFAAQILARGERRHLGTFDTPEAAYEAYLAAKRALHPGCTL